MAKRTYTREQQDRRNEKARERRAADPMKAREYIRNKAREYRSDWSEADYANHATAMRAARDSWSEDQRERNRARSRKENTPPDKWSARLESIRDYMRAAATLRRVRKTHNGVATDPVEIAQIKSLYAEARTVTELTGIEHHVDHVVPVAKGGPHRLWNLQIIPKTDNLKKNAKVDPDLLALL